MNKILVTCLVLMNLFLSINSSAQEIEWYSWEDGIEKALKEDKIIVVNVFKDNCYWCKVMDTVVYSNNKIKERINKNYIPVKLNTEKAGKYVYDNKTYTAKGLVKKLSHNKFKKYPGTLFVFPKRLYSFMKEGETSAFIFDGWLTIAWGAHY